jgi:putative addiction module component (TIGR02574 family)
MLHVTSTRLDTCRKTTALYIGAVATISELEKLALNLPESERAVLATHLLGSLSPVLHDDDDGVAEALRRDAELDQNRESGMSVEQLDEKIERRRK